MNCEEGYKDVYTTSSNSFSITYMRTYIQVLKRHEYKVFRCPETLSIKSSCFPEANRSTKLKIGF